ncbi:hypothetical protein DFH09DRAFT_1072467 [Mycena vulgaris]|nr:hypothetical protein DFH09DRAFT_1072467 [Mycena vulgaris]
MPAVLSLPEARRLFGPTNRPADVNARHCALLRKALEAWRQEELDAIFDRPIKLRLAMGSNYMFAHLGKIYNSFVRNNRLVTNETPPPPPEVQEEIRSYRVAYDTYFKCRGNNYAVRNPAAKSLMQAAEQRWHEFIVAYRAARGMPGRPTVHIAPRLAPAPTRACAATRRLGVTHNKSAATPRPTTASSQRRRDQLPTAPPTAPAPIRIDLTHIDDEPARRVPKRKFKSLVISDEEGVAERPPKRINFLGHIDLTI